MENSSVLINGEVSQKQLRKVVWGASLGTAFEWYDFFIFATLATTVGPLFFPKSMGETGIFLASLATYASGLILRPFGSLVFGRMGDVVGRKTTFVTTMILMGVSTASVGLLPTYETVGIWAPVMLVILRCLQGLALGGEYGGAVTYVAEHVKAATRGYVTSWIQICATMGFFLSLLVVLLCKAFIDDDDFKEWGWRLPFLVSIVLCIISYYVRLRLNESPVFLALKAAGNLSRSPLRDSFLNWKNLYWILLSLFGAVAGVGIVWYTGQFYVLFFLTKTLKIDPSIAYSLLAIALALSMPFYLVAGALSDRFGRKRILLIGFLLAIATYFPIFNALTHFANPALERAMKQHPVKVIADNCSTSSFSAPVSDCGKLKEYLNSAGVPHTVTETKLDDVLVQIGAAAPKQLNFAQLEADLRAAAYPQVADPSQINYVAVAMLLFVLALYICLAYGPVAAYLVELFPTKIRYSSISISYHLGTGYFGGGMLYISTLISTSTGDIYAGLYYPLAVILMSLVIGGIWLPETHKREFDHIDTA